MAFTYTHCSLCPRGCGVNRTRTPGRCGATAAMRVARAAPHHWEEPCLSGRGGSGTVFFAGCGLGCAFCQNHSISRGGEAGREVTPEQLAGIFLRLQAEGVHNLNLVSATHFLPGVTEALTLARSRGLRLPVVWNTGGYETRQALAALEGLVDVWLTDLKFHSPALAKKLAAAPDYFAHAAAAAEQMCRMAGPPVLDGDGLLQRGVILRLLVLPGQKEDAKALLRWVAATLPANGFMLSLMRQYTPPEGLALPKPFHRRLASYEYNGVVDEAVKLGLTQGFTQQKESAESRYTPPFDGTGV